MIATLFLLLAGIQTASAQGMRVWQNGDYFFFPFSNVDSIQLTPLNPVTNISLSQEEMEIVVNEKELLTAVVSPADADCQIFDWTSSNPQIANVDHVGMVTAKAVGSCTITCSARDGSGVKAECQVTVVKKEDTKEYVDLGLPSGTLWATCNIGASTPFEYGDYFAWGETEPKDDYSWSTYKHCMGLDNTITKYCAESDYGYNGFTDELTELLPEDDAATVNWGSSWQIPSLDQWQELTNNNYTTTIWPTQNGMSGYMILSKSNANFIFLPAAGRRKDTSLNRVGEYGYYWSRLLDSYSPSAHDLYFYSSYVSRYSDDYRYYGYTVRPVHVPIPPTPTPVTGITLSQTSLSLSIGASQTLTATILPANATNKDVTWSSSDSNIATVNKTGKVTAKASGSCIITCAAQDGSGVKAECAVTVLQSVTHITLSQALFMLPIGETVTLTATILPDNAANKSVTWSSSDTGIATVDQAGNVTAIGNGTCTITCSATDGSGVKAECLVTVMEPGTFGTSNGHGWVNLGLPSGTLWATCNVGASSPEEFGDYFAWGETSAKSEYSWSTYKWCKGSWGSLTKYCTDGSYGSGGFTDGNTELDPSDDAATVNWGSQWQMPSKEQRNELVDNCTREFIWVNGNRVARITGPNGNFILLPTALYYDGVPLVGHDENAAPEYRYCNGFYWTRSLEMMGTSGGTYEACCITFGIGTAWYLASYGDLGRNCGLSVRPVLATQSLANGGMDFEGSPVRPE